MVFFLNYVYSLLLAYLISKNYSRVKVSAGAFLGVLLPIFLIWLSICGGQYDVGTDYWSYYGFFNGEDFYKFRDSGEYLFAWIISLCNSLGLYGQSLFYVFYGINFYFFYLILKRIDLKYIFLFILLYITITGLFNNQLNALRQATAIYMGTYALILIVERKKWKAFFFIILSALIHRSAFFLLVALGMTRLVRRLMPKSLFVLLCISLCCSFVLRVEMLELIIPYLSDIYTNYIMGQESGDKSILLKITKLIFIPFYLFALFRFKKMELTELETVLFKWGFISFCLRLMVLNMSVVYRIFDYFLLLSVFPFYYYLRYLVRNNRSFVFVAIVFLLSVFYILKVTVFASAEYQYESVYFS